MNVAHYLVEGCDIWLNNPRRPLEASGTSGMKVIANAGLNFSVLDGWWDEGFDPEVGWKIGNGEEYNDPDYQDEVESRQLYNTLETSIVPLFYSRSEDHLPRKWIAKVKNSMKKLGPFFNTHRMVQQYFNQYYSKSFSKRVQLMDDKWAQAKKLTSWKEKIKSNWGSIKVIKSDTNGRSKQLFVGQELTINAEIDLGKLTTDDVEVQIYYGQIENENNPQYNSTVVMNADFQEAKNGLYKYSGIINCIESGHQEYTIRILPKYAMLIHPFELDVVYWAN
jgi:starch phosphorylase